MCREGRVGKDCGAPRDEGGSVEEDGTGNRLSVRQGSVFFFPQRTRSAESAQKVS